MFASVSRARRAIICTVFGLGSLGLCGAPHLAAQEKPAVINVKKLSPEQFQKLFPTWPDSTVLEADGKRVTVGELRAKAEQQRAAARAKMEESARNAAAELERRRAAFRESEKARLEAGRKAAMAYFQRLPKTSPESLAELQAIRHEMSKLRERMRTANPKEQEETLRRAYELVHKYSQLIGRMPPEKPR